MLVTLPERKLSIAISHNHCKPEKGKDPAKSLPNFNGHPIKVITQVEIATQPLTTPTAPTAAPPVVIGSAMCSLYDQFKRKSGVALAGARALKKLNLSKAERTAVWNKIWMVHRAKPTTPYITELKGAPARTEHITRMANEYADLEHTSTTHRSTSPEANDHIAETPPAEPPASASDHKRRRQIIAETKHFKHAGLEMAHFCATLVKRLESTGNAWKLTDVFSHITADAL